MIRCCTIPNGRNPAWTAVLFAAALLAGCATATRAEDPAQRSPERAEFEQIFSEWKGLLAELRQLKQEHTLAEPERRAELAGRYKELVEKSQVMETAFVDAAVVACVRRPEENQDLVLFLMEAAGRHIQMEEYEDALRLSQILIDHRLGSYWPYFCAVIAGCAVGEFELAEKHLQYLDKNRQRLPGNRNPFQAIVDECREMLPYYRKVWERERKLREEEKLAGDLPRVVLRTNKGEIELELFENEAPNTVANFVSLVEQGFYDGLKFHRVLPQLMAHGGSPTGNDLGYPGYRIRCERFRDDHRLHFRGSLSMARGEKRDTAGCQFFISFRPNRSFDGKFTVFGRVVRGMEVLSRLQHRDPPEDPNEEQFMPPSELPEADRILEARVLRKRNHVYDPKIIIDPKPDITLEELMQP